jgi:transcriptional regulator of arginine metabolism
LSYSKVLDSHIIDIVNSGKIYEQIELQDILKKRGYDIPQATLSRRLKNLNIAKVGGLYKLVEASQIHLPMILNMQVSEFGIIVLHTLPGNANSLAIWLDQKYVDFSNKQKNKIELLGTIAGDDTILLIAKNKSALKNILANIKKDFPYVNF